MLSRFAIHKDIFTTHSMQRRLTHVEILVENRVLQMYLLLLDSHIEHTSLMGKKESKFVNLAHRHRNSIRILF